MQFNIFTSQVVKNKNCKVRKSPRQACYLVMIKTKCTLVGCENKFVKVRRTVKITTNESNIFSNLNFKKLYYTDLDMAL